MADKRDQTHNPSQDRTSRQQILLYAVCASSCEHISNALVKTTSCAESLLTLVDAAGDLHGRVCAMRETEVGYCSSLGDRAQTRASEKDTNAFVVFGEIPMAPLDRAVFTTCACSRQSVEIAAPRRLISAIIGTRPA